MQYEDDALMLKEKHQKLTQNGGIFSGAAGKQYFLSRVMVSQRMDMRLEVE